MTSPLPQSLAPTLLAAEKAGLDSAHVRDVRPAGREPLGQHVELHAGGRDLRFYWGQVHELGTAAYWTEQTRRRQTPTDFALGKTLAEEIAACLLGGYGIPAAVGLAAFREVREKGLLDGAPSAAQVEAVLAIPIRVPGRASLVRYRFARQRSQRLAAALEVLDASTPPDDSLELRAWLMRLPGIGPKTASWIVRNHHACDQVAIIDIHVHRAGIAAGFFSSAWRLPRDYAIFEDAFCQVAAVAGVSAASLDACIWDQMQRLGRAQRLLLGR
jgi:N-glycosylase/DNA lyase